MDRKPLESYVLGVRRSRRRGQPLPQTTGEALLMELLAEIDDEEQLAAALGVSLTPPAPSRSHAPRSYGPLRAWLERSDEAHCHREQAWREERRRLSR
jgi:hypothetical protein